MMETLTQDIRFGVCMLAKRPAFTAIVVLVLAVGSGANTALFSVFKTVVLSPLPISQLQTLTRMLNNTMATPRFCMMLLLLVVTLAMMGIYAAIAYALGERMHEIGIRMVSGAERWDVLALVFRQNAVSTLLGRLLGILLAIGLTSLIRNSLQGISPMGPVSIITTVVVLAMISLLAGYVPARRAVRIEPMEALRYE